MIILSDDEITTLLREEKPIPDGLCPITKMSDRHRHKRKNYSIVGESGKNFEIMIRQSTLNIMDFSVILSYQVPRWYRLFRLRRYNGKSHRHTNTIEGVTFDGFHIHTATERYQQRGFKEDHFAETTNRYYNLDSAVQCLLQDCGFRSPIEDGPLFRGMA
jgi:hypothetical protein